MVGSQPPFKVFALASQNLVRSACDCREAPGERLALAVCVAFSTSSRNAVAAVNSSGSMNIAEQPRQQRKSVSYGAPCGRGTTTR